MKRLDRFLQQWRIGVASRYVPADAFVLDVGCANGALFRACGPRLRGGVGIDPRAEPALLEGRFSLLRGRFPSDLSADQTFDVITLLAVLEHVPESEQEALVAACRSLLRPAGKVVLTVPSPAVDGILRVLRFLHLVEGMSLEEHHGFRPEQTQPLFEAGGFTTRVHRRFQCGLNHLWVFERG